MTRSQKSDEWKQQLMAAAEDFDVKDRVLHKIKERQQQMEGNRMKKRISLIVAATLVFGVTSAYAAIKVHELKNDQGEAVVKIEKSENQLPAAAEHEIKTFEDVRNSLQPGESAAVYFPGPDNPKKRVSFTRIPVVHETSAALQNEVGGFYVVPVEIAGGYTFVNGHVDYPFNYRQPELFAEMYEEAEKEKKVVVVRKVSPEPKIERVVTTYKGSAGEAMITVTNFEDLKYISEETGPDGIVEKVKVQNKEAIYMESKLVDGTDQKVVKFYQDDKKRLFEVIAMNSTMTKEDLLAIAEELR